MKVVSVLKCTGAAKHLLSRRWEQGGGKQGGMRGRSKNTKGLSDLEGLLPKLEAGGFLGPATVTRFFHQASPSKSVERGCRSWGYSGSLTVIVYIPVL